MGTSLKIGFVKKRFNPYGGAENYLQTVMARLIAEGFEVHVFCTGWAGSQGVRVHSLKALGFASALSVWSFDREARRAVEAAGLDCVFSFERAACGDIYRAGDGCHRQWLDIRGSVEGRLKALGFRVNPLHRVLLGLERKIFDEARVVIANSEMVREQIASHYGVPAGRLEVVRNGVDLVRFNPSAKGRRREEARRSIGAGADGPLLLFVGSGYERKGLGTLLGAMPLVDKAARLAVIGKGRVKRFRVMAESMGVSDRVFFLGPRTGLEDYYLASDLFVLPTLYDPFSNATIEAMASGLPVVTTKNNGASELVEDGRQGYVVEDFLSSGELASKINLALAGAARMGAEARAKAEGFPVEAAVSRYVEIIKRCL